MFLPLHRLVSPSRHYLSLTLLFLCWKSLLLFIVLLAPGPGYDTSTTLLRWIGGNGWAGSLDQTSQTPNSIFARALNHLATRVVRWDAIYFTQIAQRGYVYEQEWAFGWGFTRTLSWLARTLFRTENLAVGEIALAGVVLAHLCHWGSVLLLYELTSAVFGGNGKGEVVKENTREEGKPEVLAFMSACLHIISPAGVFLSAPYAEAPFSLLNFGGCYTYILAVQAYLQRRDGVAHGLMVMVGVLFGVASIFRGNGLFSGLLLVYEAVKALRNIYMLRCEERSFLTDLTRLIVVGLTGILMACIAIWPQYLAYREYCLDLKPGTERPWCRSKIPSIYAWVQQDNWYCHPHASEAANEVAGVWASYDTGRYQICPFSYWQLLRSRLWRCRADGSGTLQARMSLDCHPSRKRIPSLQRSMDKGSKTRCFHWHYHN